MWKYEEWEKKCNLQRTGSSLFWRSHAFMKTKLVGKIRIRWQLKAGGQALNVVANVPKIFNLPQHLHRWSQSQLTWWWQGAWWWPPNHHKANTQWYGQTQKLTITPSGDLYVVYGQPGVLLDSERRNGENMLPARRPCKFHKERPCARLQMWTFLSWGVCEPLYLQCSTLFNILLLNKGKFNYYGTNSPYHVFLFFLWKK